MLRLADHEIRPPRPLDKCPSAPSLERGADKHAQLRGSCAPMSKRYDVSCEILGRESGKPRPQLQAILKSMRRPIHEIHGLDAGHWYAAVERARSAERRRRGGIDKRPVPSWNFRGGGPLKPLPNGGPSPPALDNQPALSLRWKLNEQLQRQMELREKLRQLEESEESMDPAMQALSRAPDAPVEGLPDMDDATVIRLLEEQREMQSHLHEKLEHLLDRPSTPKDVPKKEKQLNLENEQLEKRLLKQMEEIQSQEAALQRLQEQAKDLQAKTVPEAAAPTVPTAISKDVPRSSLPVSFRSPLHRSRSAHNLQKGN